MIRSSKSIAPAATRRRWYSLYASARAFSRAVCAWAANVSWSISSFFRFDTWAAIAFGGNCLASSSSSRQASAIRRWESAWS